jgi:ADP-ribose pyrophosphatase YjhB (NUDIX family)
VTLGSARWARPVAVGIAWRGRELLVSEGLDSVKQERFYRPLGGTIEFGESGAEAVVREFEEEIGARVQVIRYLGTLENIFTFEGARGHELVRVYEVECADRSFYASDEFANRDGVQRRVGWRSIEDLASEPFYPDGLRELLAA